VAALYWWYASVANPGAVSDFDQLVVAARVLLDGGNPYEVLRGGSSEKFGFGFYYPLPAAVAATPLVWFPLLWARAIYCVITMGALAYVLAGRSPWSLVALMSAPAFQTVSLAQWSAMLALAVLAPAWGMAGAGKPNAWLPVLAGVEHVDRSLVIGVAGALALCALSFWFLPSWPRDWLAAIRDQAHFRPLIARPFGWVLLATLLRPRDPRARWLVVTALIPGTPLVYAALPLLVYPWPRRQLLVLCLLSHLAMWVPMFAARGAAFSRYADVAAAGVLWALYVPAMLWVLTERSP
jgi:hypothetical protein